MSFDLATQFQINGSASYNGSTGEIDLTTLAGGANQAGTAFLKGVLIPSAMIELTIGYRYESVAGGGIGHLFFLADAATVPETAVGFAAFNRGGGGLPMLGVGEQEPPSSQEWTICRSSAGFGLSLEDFGSGPTDGIHDVVTTFTPINAFSHRIVVTVDGVEVLNGLGQFVDVPTAGLRVAWSAATASGSLIQRHSLLSVSQFDLVIPEPNWIARRTS